MRERKEGEKEKIAVYIYIATYTCNRANGKSTDVMVGAKTTKIKACSYVYTHYKSLDFFSSKFTVYVTVIIVLSLSLSPSLRQTRIPQAM